MVLMWCCLGHLFLSNIGSITVMIKVLRSFSINYPLVPGLYVTYVPSLNTYLCNTYLIDINRRYLQQKQVKKYHTAGGRQQEPFQMFIFTYDRLSLPS